MMYAIRHKASGLYFPHTTKYPSRLEPKDFQEEPSRLWRSKRIANTFLSLYCKGHVKAVYDTDYNDLGPLRFQVGTEFDPSTARNRDDFEVVPVKISVIPF